MYHYTIKADGEMVGIVSDADLHAIFDQWKELLYLTNVEVSLGGEHEFTLVYSNNSLNEVLYSENRVCINMKLEDLGTGELLVYAIQPFFEILHQRKSIVSMHAAAVEISGKAVLLLGKSGAGKTSLALSLCRNHHARLIGNDVVKVGLVGNKLVAYSGSKYFFLREESIKRNIPDLLSLFPDSNKDSWSHKIYCEPGRLKVDSCDEVTPITHSFLVHIDETMDQVHITNANPLDTKLYLNEDTSRYIRGTAISLFGKGTKFAGYVPSFDTHEFYNMRTELIESLISKIKVIYTAGSLHSTCNYIISQMET